MKTTPWFPGDVKPVRVGVYQRLHPHALVPMFSYWGGAIWCVMSTSSAVAHTHGLRCIGSNFQGLEWRGLTEPKEEK